MASLSQQTIVRPRPGIIDRNGLADRFFYFFMSLIVAGVVVAGFSRTIDPRLIHAVPVRPWVLYLHGIVFFGCVIFFVARSALICARKVTVHRTLGWFGVARYLEICGRRRDRRAARVVVAAIVLLSTTYRTSAQNGSPGPMSGSCGVLPSGASVLPVFPTGQFPVKLPSISLLGARNDLPNPYSPGVSWGELPAGRKWGSTASIAAAPDGTLWVADRCGVFGAELTTCGNQRDVNPIFQFDKSGKLLKSFGAGMFISPHKLSVDKEGNLWLADAAANQVFKLSPDGRILLTLGKKGVAGTGIDEFDAPTDVAIAPNGDIFVADGHTGGGTALGNARIVKFDRHGKFLKTWGRKGMGPGEFDVIHTLAFDSQGRLFVGDRQNNRIQIFDQDGRFIAQWFQFGRPSGIYIDKNDVLYVADSESRDGRTNTGQFGLPQTGYGYNLGAQRGIRIGSARDGSVKYFIPDPCPYPYPANSSMAEGVTVDSDGNVYGAEYLQDVKKYVRK